ncbi:MAG: aminopeptidase P family protein [Deltaproteobacteria bacterium]|nr:aminopeptidase P family protein [Deltaproteobacteria bacterium]
MEHFIEKRLQSLVACMVAKDIDTFLALIPENRYYLSGFTGEDTGCAESAGALVISENHRILATDSRFILQAEAEAAGFDIQCYKKGLAELLPDLLDQTGTRRLGFESEKMTVNLLTAIRGKIRDRGQNIDLVETKGFVEEMRAIKSEIEIEKIKESCMVADRAFTVFMNFISEEMTEKQAAWALEKAIREQGADSLSFPVIAASGENSALPHAIAKARRFKTCEPLLFDWGARLNGYCSDATRTLVIGKPDSRFTEVFNAVYDAHMKAFDAVRPGITTLKTDAVARDFLCEKGLGDFFGHGLGHGVGIGVHEQPSLSPLAERETIIEENMVITIEPGVYIPGWGGVRLENMIIVKSNGAEPVNSIDLRLSPL